MPFVNIWFVLIFFLDGTGRTCCLGVTIANSNCFCKVVFVLYFFSYFLFGDKQNSGLATVRIVASYSDCSFDVYIRCCDSFRIIIFLRQRQGSSVSSMTYEAFWLTFLHLSCPFYLLFFWCWIQAKGFYIFLRIFKVILFIYWMLKVM